MGFQYNGITSQSMSVKAHLTGWQMVPTLRSNTETVPGKAGLADFGADSGERYIDVACNVYPQKTFADMVAILDQVAAWLDPTAGTKQLVLDDVPDRYFMARLSDTVDCERLLRAAGSFTLRFLCPDPYGYALDDETFTLSQAGSMKWSVKSETQTPSQCILCKEQFPLARLYSRPMEKPCGDWPTGCG